MRRNAFTALLLMLVVACAPSIAKPTLEPQVTPAIEITATSTVSDKEQLEGAVIIYERSGGLAGLSEQWNFYHDGHVISDDGQEYLLDENQISDLLIKIEDLGFFEIDDANQMLSDCYDCYKYKLTVRSDKRIKSISMVEGSDRAPDQLWKILEMIKESVFKLQE